MSNTRFALVLTALFLILIHKVNAQQVAYAREVIDTLSGNFMKGRGYVANGDRNAANYLAAEFAKAGLKKFSKTYFQTFTTPVNSFQVK